MNKLCVEYFLNLGNKTRLKYDLSINTELENLKIAGDANCDENIDVRDVTIINQYLIKQLDMNDEQKSNADVIRDGVVDISDLGQLKKYILKLIDKF